VIRAGRQPAHKIHEVVSGVKLAPAPLSRMARTESSAPRGPPASIAASYIAKVIALRLLGPVQGAARRHRRPERRGYGPSCGYYICPMARTVARLSRLAVERAMSSHDQIASGPGHGDPQGNPSARREHAARGGPHRTLPDLAHGHARSHEDTDREGFRDLQDPDRHRACSTLVTGTTSMRTCSRGASEWAWMTNSAEPHRSPPRDRACCRGSRGAPPHIRRHRRACAAMLR